MVTRNATVPVAVWAAAAVLGGCYESTGASFIWDAGRDHAVDSAPDPAVDDPAVEDAAQDELPADVPADDAGEPPPPDCTAPPLNVVTGVDYLGESSPRVTGAAFYDAVRDRVVVYGGLRGSGDYTPDAVAVELDTGEIKLLTYESFAPQGWTFAGTAHDPDGDRVFVVGGTVVGDASRRALVITHVGDDHLSASTLPSFPDYGEYGLAVGYDPVGRRLVVVRSREDPDGSDYGETWILDPDMPSSGWTLIDRSSAAVPYTNLNMVHVPGLGLVMLTRESYDYVEPRRLWVLPPASSEWTEIPLDPAWIPGNRPACFYDPASCSLIVWGGGCTEHGHAVDLLVNPGRVTEIELAVEGLQPRVFLNAALDTRRRRIVVQGGYDCGVWEFLPHVEALSFD